jgi:hypothetical protein
MDINDQLQPVVASLLDSLKVSMEQQIRDRVTQEVINKIASNEITAIAQQVTTQQLQDRLSKFNFEATSQEELNRIVGKLITQFEKNLVGSANNQIRDEINKLLSTIDIRTVVDSVIENKLKNLIISDSFPTAGIPHSAINFQGFTFTGDQIQGGIVKNFSSTGIDDRANNIQLTLMDHGSAFEGPLFAPSASIKGTLIVDGDLILKGDIPDGSQIINKLVTQSAEQIKSDSEFIGIITTSVKQNIASTGIDLDKITQNNKEVIIGNQIGYHIVDSNLQRVGMLRDLQTQGESVLSDTLYVTSKRVGINTLDPSAVFVVWDEEVEMVISKRGQDVGYIGTPRYQSLILGSNNKNNLTLNPDGSVEVENLRVGNTPMSSEVAIPNYNAITGTIVWNENPAIGGPVGWICLGGSRWAKFGIIE